ncbi:MAG: hypothetical protein AABZ32_07820, partial [Bacteroidota bacterium]
DLQSAADNLATFLCVVDTFEVSLEHCGNSLLAYLRLLQEALTKKDQVLIAKMRKGVRAFLAQSLMYYNS